MRLEYAPQLFVRIVVCSVECSFDLSRMVSIVIDNRYAADLAFFLETTFGAAEFLKTDTGMFHGNAHLIGQGDGSQSIADIVDTRNVQHKMTEQGISFIAVKGRMCEFVKRNIGSIIIAGSVHTVGYDLAGQSFCQLIQVFNLTVDDQRAVVRQQLGKFAERMADIIKILEEIQMIRIDI